jgi:hypothetical protein
LIVFKICILLLHIFFILYTVFLIPFSYLFVFIQVFIHTVFDFFWSFLYLSFWILHQKYSLSLEPITAELFMSGWVFLPCFHLFLIFLHYNLYIWSYATDQRFVSPELFQLKYLQYSIWTSFRRSWGAVSHHWTVGRYISFTKHWFIILKAASLTPQHHQERRKWTVAATTTDRQAGCGNVMLTSLKQTNYHNLSSKDNIAGT